MNAAAVSALIVLLLGLSYLHVATGSNVSGSALGFSIDLIHRDSPESPFHDPVSTPFSHHAAIRRSVARADPHINISSSITEAESEYLMRFYIGTPKKAVYALIDTGSRLTWVLCSVCKNCYKHTGKLFFPKKSSSYRNVMCRTEECNLVKHLSCKDDTSTCKYKASYADGSSISGVYSIETLTFNSIPDIKEFVEVSGILFGCTHHTKGDFNRATIGIVGLSGHKFSLIGQLGPFIGNKFSYCLPSKSKSTQMYFGAAAVISDPSAVSTHLHLSNPGSLFHIEQDGISVVDPHGTTFTIKFQQMTSLSSNYMLIDSGYADTTIEPEHLEELIRYLLNVIPNERVPRPPEANPQIDLCFDLKNKINLPYIILKFKGGANLTLLGQSIFEVVNPTTLCLNILSNIHTGGESILGFQSQKNYRIMFDLDAPSVTFVREENCS